MKNLILLLTFVISFCVDAYMTGEFDWKGHETADSILIVKMKSYELIKKDPADSTKAIAKMYFDTLASLKGNEKSAIEVSFDPIKRTVGPRLSNDGGPFPEKYYLAFLKYESDKLIPVNIDLSFVLLPEYFPLTSKMTPKEALLFELENCLKSRKPEIVKITLKNLNDISMDLGVLPSLDLLRPMLKSQDPEIKSQALWILIKQKDSETINSIEQKICSGQEDIGITGNMFYPPVFGKPALFSTKACNILASSQNFELKRAGLAMLRNNANISSIPILLKSLDYGDDDIQYDAYHSLMVLTGHIPIPSFSTFKTQKAEILKYWKNWGAKEANAFMKDPKNANITTKRDPLETSY